MKPGTPLLLALCLAASGWGALATAGNGSAPPLQAGKDSSIIKSYPWVQAVRSDSSWRARQNQAGTVNSGFAPFAGTPDASVVSRRVISTEEAYRFTLNEVEQRRKSLASSYSGASGPAEREGWLQNAATALEESVIVDIAHYWYGTPFDRNGMAETPGKGRLACSYFVVTMLQEAGMVVDRVRLSQQSAQSIAKILCKPQNLTHCLTPEEVYSVVEQRGKGLYVIAFSSHVGFLYNNGVQKYLVHASPLPPSSVACINMYGAASFGFSKFYDVGKLSDNPDLARKWLLGEKLGIR